ncbi:ribonuclease [Bacillus thuringiensis]|uniref:Ribonuclease n=2 Tax=Bacteria TaxID=2 RepID=A0A9W3TKE5_BACTU|nr:ribonuclease [Bacillus thuringiensis]AQY42335.1 ribonuclease [Bacillus thuringiensis]MDR4150302.1 ribonuclease [Bacillus thuringiensis]MEC3574861.1 ribonuclease [Bacillus thuringiensis]MED2017076.1 ribonuclease [Bacillus thuringiensis]MED2143130.1 ribonuclease [Bacillus thuringiensis]
MFKKISTLLLGALFVFILAACGSDKNDDKAVYEKEVKPQLDAMMQEYDAIWNNDWKPIWNEIESNPNADPTKLKEKMNIIQTKYTDLAKKIKEFSNGDKLSDEKLKENINTFKKEFSLAAMYRVDAARNIVQGIDKIAPMKDRTDAARKNVVLSDEKLKIAVENLGSVESTLGVKR